MKMMAKLIALMLALSVVICSLASCDALAENFGDILSQIGQGRADEEIPNDSVEDENGGTGSDDTVTDESDEKDDPEEDEELGSGSIPNIPSQNPSDFADPYRGVDKEEFYANYKPAESYVDSYYRTMHGLIHLHQRPRRSHQRRHDLVYHRQHRH